MKPSWLAPPDVLSRKGRPMRLSSERQLTPCREINRVCGKRSMMSSFLSRARHRRDEMPGLLCSETHAHRLRVHYLEPFSTLAVMTSYGEQ
jgi:hypothetical protein